MTITVQWTGGNAGRMRARARSLAAWTVRAAGAVVRPHRKALSNLGHMPLFIAGGASIDFAAFHVGHGWGWLVTGVSLIIAELAAAEE